MHVKKLIFTISSKLILESICKVDLDFHFTSIWKVKSIPLRIEIHILSLHWMMKSISYFKVCEVHEP